MIKNIRHTGIVVRDLNNHIIFILNWALKLKVMK